MRTNIVNKANPTLASATLKVIKTKTKNIEVFVKIKNIFKEIKINSINISKIISRIIKWYQIFDIKNLKNTIWIINKKAKFIVKSKEKTIYNWIRKIKKIIIILILLDYILLL